MPKTLSKGEVLCGVMRNHNVALSLHLRSPVHSLFEILSYACNSHCVHVVINRGEDSESVEHLCELKRVILQHTSDC